MKSKIVRELDEKKAEAKRKPGPTKPKKHNVTKQEFALTEEDCRIGIIINNQQQQNREAEKK